MTCISTFTIPRSSTVRRSEPIIDPVGQEKKTVCILGASLDVGNMGCRALALSLISLVDASFPHADIYLLYTNRTAGRRTLVFPGKTIDVTIVNARLSPRAPLATHMLWIILMALTFRLLPIRSIRRWITETTPWIGVLAKADYVGDIRGGDSFSDFYGIRRITIGSLPSILAIIMGTPLIQLPQTYGPYSSPLAKVVARFILRRSEKIYARDREGLITVKELVGDDTVYGRVSFVPDVAFVLEHDTPPLSSIEPPLNKTARLPLVGLNVSGLLYHAAQTGINEFGLAFDYRHFIDALITRFMEETDEAILLVPHDFSHTPESDFDAVEQVYALSRHTSDGRIHRLTHECSPFQLKGLIGMTDFFIGSRMHACIAALSQSVPCAGIAYSHKFHGVFDSIGLAEHVLDARVLPLDQCVTSCMHLYHARNDTRHRIAFRLPALIASVQRTFAAESGVTP